MGTTPTYSWPYPEPTDPVANGAQDIEDLALAVESTVSGIGGGKILQVVSAAKTDAFTTTSTSYTTITGLSASITPSATSSKVLIIAQIAASVADNSAHYRIAGGNAAAYIGDAASNRTQSVFSLYSYANARINFSMFGLTIVYVDSPATTSSTTYTVEGRAGVSGGAYVNRSNQDTDAADYGRGASSLTVLEVGL